MERFVPKMAVKKWIEMHTERRSNLVVSDTELESNLTVGDTQM